MARTGTGTARLGEPTLTESDWAEAALQMIAEKGLRALTVSALASRLGVTKGSFYWHFHGRSALLAAALARWEQRATTETMKGLEAVTDPRRRLELMLDAASQAPRARSLYAALAEAAGDPVSARSSTGSPLRASSTGDVLPQSRPGAVHCEGPCQPRVRRLSRPSSART